ncbi:MAG: penicillin acylase family protein [Candidatus Acidiferrales bacterium]|jgi:penicillin amidase
MRWASIFMLVFCASLTPSRPRQSDAVANAAAASNAAGQNPASLEAAARAALSDTQGTKKLAGLEHEVTVLRDPWGVPHIYAQNEHDLFFAQGFVTAQDRLFQMELWKRVGQGRLAEVFGPGYIERDINARLLAYRGSMAHEYVSYAPDTKEILEAFTQGINAEIALRTAPGGPGLPLEFRLAGFAPEPWKPEDCLTRMAGFPMTGNAVRELLHAKLVTLLGASKASALLDLDPPVLLDPAPGIDLSGLSPELLSNLQGSDSSITLPPDLNTAFEPAKEEGSGKWASNNWVVSGKLTESKRPLLCNDPHRTVDKTPSLRYVVHLVAPGWNVIGATEPGSPGVEDGHNQRVAWGWTIFGMDQQDLYLETLDPNDQLRYKTEKGWDLMRVEKSAIRVKGRADVNFDLKFTRHGPVLWEDVPTHRALALRWIGAEPGTAGYLACLTLDRVKNWQEFEEAVKRWKLPTENIVYADIDGNIGEHSVGMAPIRKNFTGTIPEPGDGGFEWAGWVPTQDLPHQFNPERGFVVTANQRMIPEDFAYKVGHEWAEPYRADRVTELLNQEVKSGHKISRGDMERMQADVTSLPAREFVRLLSSAAQSPEDAPTQLLVHWNAVLDRDSPAAALYELWQIEIERQMLRHLAPEKAWSALQGRIPLSVVLRRLQHPDEDTFAPQAEAARDQLLRDTLKAASERMKTLQGPRPSDWSWGRLHTVRFHHVLELLPGAQSLFDLGPLPRPGDSYTVNNAHYHGENFDQVSGPSYREILDVGNWDESEVVNVPGESGQPGSAHYSDLVPLWDQTRYFPMLYSRAAIEKQAKDRLVLQPASRP